jgi:hypothetical protein
MIRSSYSTMMNLFLDGSPPVPVRWYFADDSAQDLGLPTPFSSRNWLGQLGGWPQLGEVYGAARPWNNGDPPFLSGGDHHCGTDEQWSQGVDSPTPTRTQPSGQPLCCPPKQANTFGIVFGMSVHAFLVPTKKRIFGIKFGMKARASLPKKDVEGIKFGFKVTSTLGYVCAFCTPGVTPSAVTFTGSGFGGDFAPCNVGAASGTITIPTNPCILTYYPSPPYGPAFTFVRYTSTDLILDVNVYFPVGPAALVRYTATYSSGTCLGSVVFGSPTLISGTGTYPSTIVGDFIP